MSDRELAAKISAAYAWYQGLGNSVSAKKLATFVINRAHPRVRSANHVSRVSASTPAEILAVFAEAERCFAHCRQQAFLIDCFTPPSFVARLAFDGYLDLKPVIQMALLADLNMRAGPKSALLIRPVVGEGDWRQLSLLAKIDFGEGLGSGEPLDPEVAHGLVDGWRRKSAAARFFIAEIGGEPCAYGSAVKCPNGVGILEDFFTLPACRGRGIATAIINQCVQRLREKQSEAIFIGALAKGGAKNLHARLGFAPLLVSSEWVMG